MDTLAITVVLSLAAAGSSPLGDVPRDQVDLIEINHFHDDRGKHVFDQIIFYEWSDDDSRYQVRSWRLLKASSQKPVYHSGTGFYTAVWNDGDHIRVVRSAAVRETWTQHDPELSEREHFPKEKRRDLVRTNPGGSTRKKAKEAIAKSVPPEGNDLAVQP